jgi:gamma-glutamyltranspeptidase / glutathione hydrolase
VEPHLNGPGGEVPILAYRADRGETLVVNGQGPARAAASIAHFEDLGLDLVPGTGLLPACVPGAFDAWMLLLGEFGTLRLADVMQYAIGYAEHGYPLVPRISDAIRNVERLFREEWPSSARVYLKDAGAPEPGTLFANPDLARAYRRIVDEAEAKTTDRDEQIQAARDAFYRGFVAEAIDGWVTTTRAHFPNSFYPRVAIPGEVAAEARLGSEVFAALRARGHSVTVVDGWSLGRLSAVSQDPRTGVLRAAANPRGMQGYAVGR